MYLSTKHKAKRDRPPVTTDFSIADTPSTLYAFVTRDKDLVRRGARRRFVITSARATAGTSVEVLGHDGKTLEYSPKTDASPRFEQKEDGLHIDIMRAQRVYNNSLWPNPVTVKITNIEQQL